MAQRNLFWRVLEYLGHAETIHTLVTADFVMRLVWPTVLAVIGAASGWIGGIPVMWIMVGTVLIFGGVVQTFLRVDEYRERKDPSHKLAVIKTLFNYTLAPVPGPNRRHRRSAAAQGGAPAVPAFRNLIKGQLGIEVWNRSSFPMSLIVQAAETKVEELEPPRVKYPKKPVMIQPGQTMWVHDEPIDMGDMLCDNLEGEMDITVKYGLPGRENFEIHWKGTVEIFMEQYGQLKVVYFHPASSDFGAVDAPVPG